MLGASLGLLASWCLEVYQTILKALLGVCRRLDASLLVPRIFGHGNSM